MERFSWYFDELAHAGDEHLDPDYVTAYDRKAGTDPTDDLLLLRDLGLDQHSTLVDLGAGSGTFTLAAAPYCRQVLAVDVSPAMLALLRAKVEQRHLRNVTPVHAGFLSYEHQGEPADFIYTRNALHHLPDFWKALALTRIASMLKPGGVLRLRDLVFSFEPGASGSFIDGWLTGATQRSAEGWTRAELEEHLRQEYSTFSWLLESMLSHAGFGIRQADFDSTRIYAAYTCVKG